MKIWTVHNGSVRRKGVEIARCWKQGSGSWRWCGMGLERRGFRDPSDVLADVKYFHRHRPPSVRITFTSGRVVEVP